MDLLQDVLSDIEKRFNVNPKSNSIDANSIHNDLDFIQDVLSELHCPFKTNTIQFIKSMYVNTEEKKENDNCKMYSSAIPETPFAQYSKRHKHVRHDNKKKHFNQDIDFNIFSFASDETQISPITQRYPIHNVSTNYMQYDDEFDSQMDIDNDNDSQNEGDKNDDYFDMNGIHLSQSLYGLQLTQTQDMSLSPELTK